MTSAAPAPTAPATGTRRVTRDDLIRLGQAGRPWDFLPLAATALAQIPHDGGLRFLTAAALARLGLRTLALEELAALGAEANTHPDVATLRTAVEVLPGDALSTSARAEHLRRNTEVLKARGIDLGAYVQRWIAGADKTDVFHARDGNAVLRAAGVPGVQGCRGLFDGVTFAANAATQAKLGKGGPDPSIVVEGVCPPWMLLGAWRATHTGALGYLARISVLQADPFELLDGLSLADLTEVLSDGRVELFVGADAAERYRAQLLQRLDTKVLGVLFTTPTLRTKCAPSAESVMRDAGAAQEREFERLRAEVSAAYAGRTPAWWARRYEEARAGREPLRVLIPTCRYTTFLQHSASDLAAAFRRLRCRADVLIEPDTHSQFSAVAYLRAVLNTRPDLVVTINYPRTLLGEGLAFPAPVVCWVQDAMPHLFDAGVGRAHGPLDFVAGHLLTQLVDKYAYPAARCFPTAVVADTAKFHPAPVEPALAERFACEVACVTHHSETPEAMHARLTGAVAHAPVIQHVFQRMLPQARAAADDAMGEPFAKRLSEAARSLLREATGAEPEERTVSLVLHQYGMPMVDRLLRHTTLAWAAEIAAARGWRFNLYGRGWESHPTLGRYAKGELAHDGELRAAYAAARVHLHVSASTLVHQRVIECALSGGLCIARLHGDALVGPKTTALLTLLQREPDVREPDRVGYTLADHPEAMAFARLRAQVGEPLPDGTLWVPALKARNILAQARLLADGYDPAQLFGDLAEATFQDRARLESLLERAVGNASWRSNTAAMIAARARDRFTHDGLVRRLTAWLGDRLKESA